MNPTRFRLLILGWWCMAAVGLIITAVTEQYLPEELRNYLHTAGAAELSWVDTITLGVAGAGGILLIVASVGLYQFKSWGRTLFLWTNLLGFVIAPVLGVSIQSG